MSFGKPFPKNNKPFAFDELDPLVRIPIATIVSFSINFVASAFSDVFRGGVALDFPEVLTFDSSLKYGFPSLLPQAPSDSGVFSSGRLRE